MHTQNNKILSKMSTNVHALVHTILLRYMPLNKVLIATAQMRTCSVASTNRLPHNTPRTWSFYSTLLRTHSPTSYGRLAQESQALLLAIIYLTSPFKSFILEIHQAIYLVLCSFKMGCTSFFWKVKLNQG